jgi:hypothetical protein
MKPERITYRKTFNLGNYSSEAIGVDMLLDDGDSPVTALNEAKLLVEQYHKESNPILYNEINEPEQIIQKETDFMSKTEQLIHDIGTCRELKVLETYKLIVRNDQAANEAYRRKLIELSTV